MIRLFHGKNTFLSYRMVHSLISELKDKYSSQSTTYDVSIFDTSATSIDQIINEIETPGLFVSQKIILLKRVSQNSDADQLKEFLMELVEQDPKSIPSDIIIWEDQKIRTNTRLAKAFSKNKALIEGPDLNKRTFLTWAKKALNESNVQISPNAIHLLSERVNYNPERLTQETAKIKLLGEREITEEDIERVCPDTLEHSIWELIDAINSGNNKESGKKLNMIIRQGNDPFFVLFMIARNLRMILLTKILLNKNYNTAQIARKIKAHPFTINKMKRTAQSIQFSRIKKIYEKLCSIDYSGKTGQLDVELALNILLSVI